MIKCTLMAILKVLTYPNPILQKKAETVQKIGPAEQRLIQDMIETMYTDDGVGLAAPQVGVSKRIFVASPTAKPGEEMVFINLKILESSGTQIGPEGCLSLPGISGQVQRAKKIKYEAMDKNGKWIAGEASDFLARIIQHELDHLDGKLLIDRVDFLQRQEILSEYQLI